jgi:DNA-binding CsgD family transcriptional regulator/tetratricopeptide (TPR) repeat protein
VPAARGARRNGSSAPAESSGHALPEPENLSVVRATMWIVPRLGSEAPLVGRADELGRLTGALDRARAGRPAAVLLAGDAGVGKTRLLRELTERARAEGAFVLVGHCVDLGTAGLPYLPFAEVLQQIAERAAGEPQLADALRSRPALARLLPAGPPTPAAPAGGDGDLGQLRLFDAVAGVLAELAATTPTLLVIEDLHWADQSTRGLLSFLLTRLRAERLAVVASYRADDLHRRHPLRPLLGELVRLPVVERLELAPFTAGEMREYLRVLHEGPLPDAVVRRIIDRSEGNAFFAEELLAASQNQDTELLPTALADVLLARLEQLPAAVQRVARVASVAGRTVEHELLQQIAGLAEAETEEALREAVTRHVLVAQGGQTYAFRHALLQEAVYGDLLPGERARLHAAYARVLADPPPGVTGSAAELAHHCLASHDLRGALAASVRAAAEASALHAPAEALRHLEQALQLWHAVPDAEQVAGMSNIRLGLRAAAAASASGELHRAVALTRAVRDRVDATADPALAAQVRQKLAHHLYNAERPEDALAEAGAALELLPVDPPSLERVWTAAVYARAAGTLRDYEDSRRLADEALAGARSLGLADAEADALATLAVLADYEGNPDAAAERLREARDRAATAGDLGVELRASYNLATTRYYQGDLPAAAAAIDAGVDRASSNGLTWSSYGVELRVLQVIVNYVLGDWDRSLRAGTLTSEQVPEPVAARLAAARLYVQVGRGLPGTAEQLREQRAAWHHDSQIALIAGGAGADAAQWRGDWPGAVALVDEAIQWLDKLWGQWQLGGIWLATVGVSASADRAAEARLRQDRDELRAALSDGERLIQHARTAAELGRPRARTMGPEGRAWLVRGEAEWARAQGLTDPELWQAAIAEFDYGYSYELARSRWRLAETLVGADRRDEAAEQARSAHQTAVLLGAEPLRTAVEALARRGRLEIGAAIRPAERDVLLTPRERDVLALLAEGRTNRQIGSTLFISEKTASVHVSNILGKLGASGRAEAVAIAHRRGLLPIQPAGAPTS